jgi:hypothetical protein
MLTLLPLRFNLNIHQNQRGCCVMLLPQLNRRLSWSRRTAYHVPISYGVYHQRRLCGQELLIDYAEIHTNEHRSFNLHMTLALAEESCMYICMQLITVTFLDEYHSKVWHPSYKYITCSGAGGVHARFLKFSSWYILVVSFTFRPLHPVK